MVDGQAAEPVVKRLWDIATDDMAELLRRFGLDLSLVSGAAEIPGSYWGGSEAGLVGAVLYCRADTPLHSILHEAGHYICMDAPRRARLYRDAGGDYAEEDAVCYLQILLADHLPGYDSRRMLADMDAWGYTFRLGSARTWFEQDADTAAQWLRVTGLTDAAGQPAWRIRASDCMPCATAG